MLLAVVIGAGVVVALTRGEGADGGHAPRIESFDVRSRLVDRTLEQRAAVPDGGGRGRPLLILLHGRGGEPGGAFSAPFKAELERLGQRAPVVVEVNGGESSYYHDRKDGRWGSYVVREAIPAAQRRYGTDPDRVAIGGFSMGGFGALDIARARPGRFCGVGAHSAAIWRRSSETPRGAFDNARDFRRHDVYGFVERNRRAYSRERLWIDVGRNDPFRAADSALARTLADRSRDITFHMNPGGHDAAYFDGQVRAYLRFYARALGSCGD